MRRPVAAILFLATILLGFAAAAGAANPQPSVRLPESVAIRGLPPASLARPLHSYGWPIRPFGVKHRIRSAFGDPRVGVAERNFHFGIDIPAPDRTPVYAVAPGRVYLLPGRVAVLSDARSGHRTGFTCWHIDPAVPQHSFVQLHSLIGWITPGWGHVHFAELQGDRYVNPLRPGALTPAPDLSAPMIESVLVEPIGHAPDTEGAVRGRIRIVAEAYVRPAQTPPSPWQRSVISPPLILWRLLARGTPASEWRTAVDFRNYIPPDSRYADVFAPEAKPDRPGKQGIFRFNLARNWDTSAIPPGAYTIQVAAYGSGNKKATVMAPLQIAGPEAEQTATVALD